MRLLFIAPQPFYQERGTPIAVKLLLEALIIHFSKVSIKCEIDLLTYHEGEEISLAGVRHIRIGLPFTLKGVTPGISFKKLVCDLALAIKLKQLLSQKRYDLIHAVEEAAALASLVKTFYGIPYLYDIDSNIVEQLCERWPLCKVFSPLASLIEKHVVRNSLACIAMCTALVDKALTDGAQRSFLLTDVALPASAAKPQVSLRDEFKIANDFLLAVYVGNLEHYQGIDLLLDAASELQQESPDCNLVTVIIGGPQHLEAYTQRAANSPLLKNVHFAGPRPVGALPYFLDQADILVSPRISGKNTPMKIYSYLAAGKAIVATRLPTHTQVLTDTTALLCEATPKEFAQGLCSVANNTELRKQLAQNALKTALEFYTIEKFQTRVSEIYSTVIQCLNLRQDSALVRGNCSLSPGNPPT